ncbi:hypothetical protein GCM10009716_42090 [Streptomyces sodiiphilus]|uniref:Thiamine pyrophosphate enzyme TPP-binding domain-containing protein n=1 Tax=Streptomyces sodiiphilus TaxID=226217 RepID=A0ABN2PRK8_9ACTN
MWNNQDLNQVTWEMRAMSGSPRFLPSQSIPDVSTAAFARSLGLLGIRVEKPEQVEDAWRQALTADRPAVVEFMTDPAVPPIPPSTDWDQLESTARSLLKGDSDRASVLRQARGPRPRSSCPAAGRTPVNDETTTHRKGTHHDRPTAAEPRRGIPDPGIPGAVPEAPGKHGGDGPRSRPRGGVLPRSRQAEGQADRHHRG